MTREEWNLLVELALAVYELAPPDRRKTISRAMEACQNAAQNDPCQECGNAEPGHDRTHPELP